MDFSSISNFRRVLNLAYRISPRLPNSATVLKMDNTGLDMYHITQRGLFSHSWLGVSHNNNGGVT
jgi:hypothetical protein